MAEGRAQSSSRVARAGLIALALLGLLVLVAIGARASHPLANTRVQQRYVPQRVGNDLFTVFVIVVGLGAVLFVAGLYSIRDEWHERETHWLRRFVASLAVLLFVLLYFVAVHAHFRRHHHAQPPGGNPRAGAAIRPHSPLIVNPKTGARFDWEFAAILGGTAALAVTYLAVRRRRAEPEPEPEQTADSDEVLSAVVREAIDDLRSEPDPRRAVIAAYARMEAVLARHGHARRPAEAPYEYLQRVLTELRVAPDAVAELTELFELAKFSPQRIGEDMRQRAIAAFVAVRDDVKVAA
jgi:NADH:ubiquinone oxidoreductase subunit 6 (subunit J)